MKILVAVDGSPYTQKALDFLAANRTTFLDGHHLILLHVSAGLPPHVTRHVTKEVVEDYYAEENAKVLDPVKSLLTTHGVALTYAAAALAAIAFGGINVFLSRGQYGRR